MRVSPFLLILLVGAVPILLAALLFSAANVELLAWRPPIAWSEQFGTSGIGIDNAVSAVAAGGSGVYTAGYLDQPVSGKATSGSLFVRNYDLAGRTVWTHDQQSVYFDQFSGISAGNGGIYVVGRVNNSVAILKFDMNGNEIWTRQIGSPNGNNNGVGIISTSTAEFVIGTAYPPITNQTFTGIVMFVREYDPIGNAVWTSEFSNSTNTLLKGLYVSTSGAYILTDGFLVKYDLDGTRLWTIGGGGIGISGDGSGVYVTEQTPFNRFTPPPQGLLTRFRSDGIVDWTAPFDVPDHSGVYDPEVSADSSGVYLSVRSTYGHAYIFRYDNLGNQLWSFEPPLSRMPGVLGVFSSTITVGPEMVYWAGAIPGDSHAHSFAYLQGFGKDASLVFFGLEPPWSFIPMGVVIAFVAVNILMHIRRKRRLAKSGSERSDKILPSGIPKD